MKRIWLLTMALSAALLTVTACGASAQENSTVDAAAPAVVAAAYMDQFDIGAAYAQAVDAMTEQGVLEGYDDGKFHPSETLTREQGAKIITYLIMGANAAEALTCDTAPYTDVAASRRSASCIAWCTEQHILDGYGGGRFGPADPLTGQQFAKMLLCAYRLGDNARYVGADWARNVSADAAGLGLYAGDAAMDFDQPLQRQQAALMASNAQTANGSAATVQPVGGASGGRGTSGGGGGSSGGDVQTPEIEIVPADNSGETEENTETGETVATDSNGDILLPEVP